MAEERGQRQRVIWGIVVSGQSVALFFSVLAVATLTGLAVLSWLEHYA